VGQVARGCARADFLGTAFQFETTQDAAKAVVSAQARAKKDVKLGREPRADKPKAAAGGGERKRVSFA